MTIDDLINKWKSESIINREAIGEEILKISDLTFQWQRLLMEENLKLKTLQTEYDKIYLERYRFYTEGPKTLKDKEDVKKIPPVVILKSDVEKWLQADDQIIQISTKIFVSKEKIGFIQSALWELRGRGKNLQNFVQWEKFMAGS